MIKLLALLAKLPAPIVRIISEVVQGIAASPDPYGRASRIAEEAARLEAFDASMRKVLRGGKL